MADRSVACRECLLDVPPVLVLLTSTVPASMFLMMIAIQEFKLKIPMTPAEGRSTQEGSSGRHSGGGGVAQPVER